jgi:nitroimidazol reductase NimA-like FMN-containing flavoprotein (pyridoxamine 5'-phosphate oxidase superfamily)
MTTHTFHPVRRQDRVLDSCRAIELLQTAEYGFLSLGESENGYAYGIPANFAYDSEENALYFHCAPEGHKLENLRRNNKVSFCVVGKTQPIREKFTTWYESVVVFGKANIHLPDGDKRTALRKLVEKYSPEYIESGEIYMDKFFSRTFAFKVEIEQITAKCNHIK